MQIRFRHLSVSDPVQSCSPFDDSKTYPATRHAGVKGEKSYSSYSFLTSVLDRGGWSASLPGHALPSGKEPSVPIG
jgi:hypothetical protein